MPLLGQSSGTERGIVLQCLVPVVLLGLVEGSQPFRRVVEVLGRVEVELLLLLLLSPPSSVLLAAAGVLCASLSCLLLSCSSSYPAAAAVAAVPVRVSLHAAVPVRVSLHGLQHTAVGVQPVLALVSVICVRVPVRIHPVCVLGPAAAAAKGDRIAWDAIISPVGRPGRMEHTLRLLVLCAGFRILFAAVVYLPRYSSLTSALLFCLRLCVEG
mmetsp:Transcript_9867/g.18811  ORF Transcript_9867/g.18811 Transcript_9867/m.18811 type:complete len:213 (+) Transcript_9867:58-696(+)